MDSVCLLFRELSTCVTYSFSGDVILSPRFSLWDHTAGSIGHTVCCKCCRGDERESSFSTPLYLLSFRLTRGTEEYTGVLELLLSKTRPRVSKTPHLGSHPFRTNLGEARGQSQERSHSVSDEELGRGVQFRGQLLGSGGMWLGVQRIMKRMGHAHCQHIPGAPARLTESGKVGVWKDLIVSQSYTEMNKTS